MLLPSNISDKPQVSHISSSSASAPGLPPSQKSSSTFQQGLLQRQPLHPLPGQHSSPPFPHCSGESSHTKQGPIRTVAAGRLRSCHQGSCQCSATVQPLGRCFKYDPSQTALPKDLSPGLPSAMGLQILLCKGQINIPQD